MTCIIHEGVGGKELKIRINQSSTDKRTADLWIEFGCEELKKESLSYMNLGELLDLKEEVQRAINKIVGVRE